MLEVNLHVSEEKNSREFLFSGVVTFHHEPMVGDNIAPETIDGFDHNPLIITARMHSPNGELDIFAVED